MNKNIIVLILLAILLPECSQWVSVNPLSSPSGLDKRLEGVWKLDSKDGDEVYLHIGKKTENTMIALSVEHKKDRSLDIVEIPFFITRTDLFTYLNIRYKDIEKEAEEKDDGFIFIKYSFADDNTLFLYQFDPEPIIAAVLSGKLQGEKIFKKQKKPLSKSAGNTDTVSDDKIDSVKITDTSENLVKFFESDGNKLLPDILKFCRMK